MVRCADCGFLGLRHKQTRQLLEAEQLFRENGYIPAPNVGGHDYSYDTLPVCSAQVADFFKECGSPDPDYPQRKKVVNSERECEKFTAWKPGFSPKEHHEMILSEKMLEIQHAREDADRDWRQKESERQRQWEAQQATIAEGRHQENLQAAITASKGNIWSNWGAGLLAIVAGAVGAILGWLLNFLNK